MTLATLRNWSRDVDVVTMNRQFPIFLVAENRVLRLPTVSHRVRSLDWIVARGALSRTVSRGRNSSGINRQLAQAASCDRLVRR